MKIMIYTILIVGIIWFTTLYYQCDKKDGILVPGVFAFHCIDKGSLK